MEHESSNVPSLSKPRLKIRKNTQLNDSGSLVIYEDGENQVQFNIKNDKEFLDRNRFSQNVRDIKQSIDKNIPHDKNTLPKLIQKPGVLQEELHNPPDNYTSEKKEKTNYKELVLLSPSSDTIAITETRGNLNNPTTILPTEEAFIVTPHKSTHYNINIIPNEESQEENPKKDSSFRKINCVKHNNEQVKQEGQGEFKCETQEEVAVNANDKEVSSHSEDSCPFCVCAICSQFVPMTLIFHALGCQHYFCIKCGKAFYEEKVEEGDFDFKCPIYKCKKSVQAEIIPQIISERHFNMTKGQEDKLKRFIQENKNCKSSVMNTIKNVKLYSKKHVIDINTNETFFKYNKAKDQFCIKCAEPALFGKSGYPYVKCLNCQHLICKYCMKSYSRNHMDMSSNSHCRVFYRTLMKRSNSDTACSKLFGFTVLIFLASYLMISFGTYSFTSNILRKVLCVNWYSNTLKLAVYYLLLAVVWIIITPVLLMMIPYFPVWITLTFWPGRG